jgi:menaquinone-specific isochorismate synthase
VSAPPLARVAVRLPLDPGPAIDPFALAGPGGFLFHRADRVRVGMGTSLTVPLPGGLDDEVDIRGVTETLDTIPCTDHCPVTAGAVAAVGSLPFDRSAPASLVIPEVIYGRDGDAEWVTVVSSSPARLPSSSVGLRSWLREASSDAAPAAGRVVRMAPHSSDQSFVDMVDTALAAIRDGEVVKVVLARHVDATVDQPIDVPGLLRRWHDLEPNCTIFSVPTPNGRFVGASPELLVERRGSAVHSRPLAGTAERAAGPTGSVLPAVLQESSKDGHEHRLVVEGIAGALGPLCSQLDVPDHPDVVHLHNLVHLGTSLRGTLAGRPTAPDALQLVAALHPTPAVGGAPTAAARAMIQRLEPEPRGLYAGPVGYVEAGGDGCWVLGIRAMTVRGRLARLTAGVGIVSGSYPTVELAETNVKLAAVVDALAADDTGLTFSPPNVPTVTS